MTNGEKFKEVFGFGADGSRVIAVNATWWDCEFQNNKPITKRVPAADVRPVVKAVWKHVKWVVDEEWQEGGYWISRCSNCSIPYNTETPFCPHCGAGMRKES